MEKIWKLLEKRGMSAAELSRATGIRQSRLSQLGKDDGKLRLPEALRIARALGTSLEYLADPEMDEPPAHVGQESPVWITIRTIAEEIGGQEAVRRLLRPPGPVFGDLPARPGEPKLEPRRGTG